MTEFEQVMVFFAGMGIGAFIAFLGVMAGKRSP